MSDATLQPARAVTWSETLAAWFQRHAGLVLLLGGSFQLVILVTMTVLRIAPLVTGETILLRVIPVDPRDLFRGDYVILGYDFSRPGAGFETAAGAGQTVYVQLEPEADGRHWRMAGISTSRPSGGKFLRGQGTGRNGVECGIESYYVQEGTGRQYEQAIRNQQLSAEVAVTADGQAALQGLRIE